MRFFKGLKDFIGGLTEIGLMLIALIIVIGLFVGPNLPFVGGVVGNIMALVKDLGANGLIGMITAGIIFWLFAARRLA
ncbi:MAG: hypothetical protein HY659_11460 [Rhizobiales bacterium]|nr:hypothetical protein [Hyphomicrobiales bacterium]